MDEQQIQSNLKKLMAGFLVICLLIGGVSRYLFRSVSDLYVESVQGRLEERALQYKKSFLFKATSDLQTLRAMERMLEDTIPESATTEDTGKLLSNLWDAGKTAGFVRLCYFTLHGDGIQLTEWGRPAPAEAGGETAEMQLAIQQALQGTSLSSQAFFDPVLGYNTIGYATPVYTAGEISGVLACAVSTEAYADILSSIDAVSDIGAAAVLSSDGRVVASTRTHQTQGFYDVDGSAYLGEELSDTFMQALSKNETQFFSFELDGLPLYACVMPMDVCSDKIVIVDTDKGVSDAVSGVVDYAHVIGIMFGVVSLLFAAAVLYINRRYHRQLLQVVYHDRLTGAYNRDKFLRILEQNWRKNQEYTVISANIRKFKYINELFSPARSDQVLRDICAVLNGQMEQGEFFCRDTADTFVLALRTLDQEDVRARLERIFLEINHSCKSVPPNYPIAFYCGCASTVDCSDKGRSEELMSHVMLALSYAKQTQQANIFFYDAEIHEKEKLQSQIENNMERALHSGEFQMYLQPKMDLEKGTLSGAEALVRWVTDGKQTIFPDQFIPVFERNGFCIQLDYYMVEQACKQIRAWIDDGLTPVPISVNQTKLLLYEEDYVERICAIARRYDVPGRYIMLEMLEGLALENPEQISARIDRLHDYGFRISMDDFGTGYSSLTTLSRIQIDELKLDRSFLAQADQSTEHNRRKILEAVIEVAKRMHISTVAEGIETPEHVLLMREMRCDYGQGYYYSRPIPAAEFTKAFLKPCAPHAQPWSDPDDKREDGKKALGLWRNVSRTRTG